MLEHLALNIFSIFVQASIGIMIFVFIAKLINKEAMYRIALITALVLGGVGLLASMFHLGTPLNGTNSLNNFATSWLSKEIWFSAIFAVLALVATVGAFVKNSSLVLIGAGLAAIVGLVDVFAMASVYTFASVPAWQSIATMGEFFTATIAMGGVLFFLLGGKDALFMKKAGSIAVIIAVAVQAVFIVLGYIGIAASGSAAAAASMTMLNDLVFANIVKWAFILAGAIALFLPKEGKSSVALIGSATGLMFVGQFVGRYVFYAIMTVITVGLV